MTDSSIGHRMTEAEVADHFRVSLPTVRVWRKKRIALPFIKVGCGSVRYREEDVIAYERSNIVGPAGWREAMKEAADKVDDDALRARLLELIGEGEDHDAVAD